VQPSTLGGYMQEASLRNYRGGLRGKSPATHTRVGGNAGNVTPPPTVKLGLVSGAEVMDRTPDGFG